MPEIILNIAAWIVLIGGGIAAVLVVLEILVRLAEAFDSKYLSETVTRFDYMSEKYYPYLRWIESWAKPMFYYLPIGFRVFNNDNPIPGYVESNAQGFRCREFTPPDADTLRIVFLGGSSAWGCGATSNETTVAGHMERILNARPDLLQGRSRCECYNLAQANGTQTHDILVLQFMAQRVQPDIVISFTGWNELVTSKKMDKKILETFGVFYVEELAGWEPPSIDGNRAKLLKSGLRHYAAKYSRLAHHVLQKISPKVTLAHPQPGEMSEHVALSSRLFLDNLRRIDRLGVGDDFLHLQVMQPHLYRKKTLSPSEAQVIELYDNVRQRHGGKTFGDFLRSEDIYAHVREGFGDLDLERTEFMDLSDMFDDVTEDTYYTLVHLNDEGYKVVAERICDTLAENLLAPQNQRSDVGAVS